jgi:hypothetical protein
MIGELSELPVDFDHFLTGGQVPEGSVVCQFRVGPAHCGQLAAGAGRTKRAALAAARQKRALARSAGRAIMRLPPRDSSMLRRRQERTYPHRRAQVMHSIR